MSKIEETSWEDAVQENNFAHLDMTKQVQMARSLKFGVQGCHKPIKKTRTRLFQIIHPEFNKPPYRGV